MWKMLTRGLGMTGTAAAVGYATLATTGMTAVEMVGAGVGVSALLVGAVACEPPMVCITF